MKSLRTNASFFLTLAAVAFLVAPSLMAQLNNNAPPFDFNDGFYGANGIDVTQLDQPAAGRFGLFRQFGPPARDPHQPNWLVDNSNNDPTRKNIRILATTGGYPDDGSGTATEFISIIAFVLNQNFFNTANQSGGAGNARGIAMQDIVGNFEGYAALKQRLPSGVLAPTPCGSMGDSTLPVGTPCFPVTSVATPAIRQDWRFATNRNAIDGSDGNDPLGIVSGTPHDSPFGYFCDDLLGMWVLTYFWYNQNSVGDPAGNIHPTTQCISMLIQLASMHGIGLDGTPNVLTANELNFLEGKDVGAQPLGPHFPNPPNPGCMNEGQLDTGGADGGAIWLICPALPDPRAGAITSDAFLDTVRGPFGIPLDFRFNLNFACLQLFGAFCNELTLSPSQTAQVISAAAHN
ncbi:MAG TPA: hypothetical protein VN380_02045 [Thermoanaerobaculia bacterium]|jgi:hypothetical protein|nr:hypothetical protein [Thermoanaerobaculia bacterium]